ncbi:MAG: S-layer homology domain-containing protein, partial [Firmicutes bacterium]|nr:S-layer homology domain-containing protein [Bacillota bacterium]
MSRSVIKILLSVLPLLVFISCAEAADFPFTVYFEGKKYKPEDNIVVKKNHIDIELHDEWGAGHVVTVGSTRASGGAGDYYVEEYPLKVGSNKITISADALKATFNVIYLDEPLPGGEYTVSSIPSSGKLEIFNKNLKIDFTKNNMIIDSDDPDDLKAIKNQGLRIEVEPFTEEPTDYHHFVSPVYSIVPDDDSDDLRLLFPGELIIKYDPSVSNAAADTLTVIFIPHSEWEDSDWSEDDDWSGYWSSRWSKRECVVMGGRVNVADHTVTVPFRKDGFGTYAVFNVTNEFSDLLAGSEFAWARSYVLAMWAKGIMESVGSKDYFGAEYEITREEFAVALVKAMDMPIPDYVPGPRPFEDIPGDLEEDDHEKYILTAARNGIINGYPNRSGNEFRPRETLNREQAAVIMARVANLKIEESDAAKITSTLGKTFSDFRDGGFSPWAGKYVLAA